MKLVHEASRTSEDGAGSTDGQLTALLAAGSHDLRGPVHHIQAYVRLLQDDHAQLAPDRLAFMLARLLRAADTVAAEFNSLTLWAKAQQGALAVLDGEPDETLDQVLDEYRQEQVLAVELRASLQGEQACPGLLFRMILAQLAALATEIGRGALPVSLALQPHTSAGAAWQFVWQGPPAGNGGKTTGSGGLSARSSLHLMALRQLATAVRGSLIESAPEDGLSSYRLLVPAG